MNWTVVFFTAIVLLFLLPLAPALLEWRNKRDAKPLKVVREYDGNIKHFAMRFRQFLNEQFADLVRDAGPATISSSGRLPTGDSYQLVSGEGKPVFSEQEAASATVSHLVLGTASLQLGDGMLYEKEVFAAGDIRVGNDNSFRALLAKGDIVLGEECDVLRWAHSDTRIEAGSKARLFGRMSANQELLLHRETRFGRMHAPLVRFGEVLAPAPAPAAVLVQLEKPRDLLNESAGRWLAKADWAIPAASSHKGDLVARADMAIGDHSRIDGGIKSHGDLRIGAGVHVTGAVVCGGNMFIGPGCVIQGPVVCEHRIEIGAGTVLGSPQVETTVTAVEIRVREGALAHGTVWARELGYVAPAINA